MSPWTTTPPARRPGLLLQPLGGGRYVVKDRETGQFFQIGEEEHFLLQQLDGTQSAAEICAGFEVQFSEPLSAEDFDDFLEMAREQRLLEIADSKTNDGSPNPQSEIRTPQPKQSILYWRKSLVDPDRFFTWVEPKIRFFWTRGFLLFSAACILFAGGLLWMNQEELAASFQSALRWETIVITWVLMLGVTTLHEFAHGLTCKHHGGEVHEIGFLLMFFMPCFYCNVSDAWLFREKSKRLWVTFAGGYFQLFLWALAVFVWRLTVPDSLVNYLAFVVLAGSGVQCFFNFNPLIKLDGYYLLSDWLEVPNLRQRAFARFKGHLRRLLWGAPQPEPEPRGRFLTGFGTASWLFSIVFLTVMLLSLGEYFHQQLGAAAFGVVALLGVVSARGLFRGFSDGEAKMMIFKRHKRTLLWLTGLGGIAAALTFIEVNAWHSGDFTLRPVERKEVRSPVAGFLKEIHVQEGDRVSPGDVIAVLEIPDLDSRIAQKRAELTAAQAKFELLQEGTKPEKIEDQRQRVERAGRWHAAAKAELRRSRKTLQADLNALQARVAASRAACSAAKTEFARIKGAFGRGAINQSQLDRAREKLDVAQAKAEQAEAELKARETRGSLVAERERGRRANELAEERATLKLLCAHVRPQEIAAAQANVDRAQAELRNLRELAGCLEVRAGVAGVIVTPHLQEKIGARFAEGETICVVEDRHSFEAEVALAEQKIAQIEPGQRVRLKARALPYETLTGRVTGIARSANAHEQAQSTVAVYCHIENPTTSDAVGVNHPLRSAQTGHARIYTDRKPIGEILLDRGLRLLRTEFWW